MKSLLFILPLLFVICSAITNIALTASVSAVGSEVHVLTKKTAALQTSREKQELELANARSLSKIASYAVTQGFVPMTGTVAVVSFEPTLALNR